jgi:hypothetical protein
MSSFNKKVESFIECDELDRRNHKMSILEDGTFRPKQLYLDKKNEKLYWSDLEGMALMHSNLDDSNIEVLIETDQSDADRSEETK